jgi:release factor glutamine methyltransferase
VDLVATLRAAGCVFAEEEAAILASADGDLAEMVARRVAGEPLETIVGWVEFAGRRLIVEPGVFVPRRRTELLARLAVAAAPRVLVDLCAGVGAVGAMIADASVHSVEIDPVAADCARRNRAGTVYVGDLFDSLPASLRGRVDVVTANAPYVPTASVAEMPREARDFEPLTALDGGADGLDVHRRILAAAPEWLAPGGIVLIEVSRLQAPALAELFEAAGLAASVVRDDDLDATVVRGVLATPPGLPSAR